MSMEKPIPVIGVPTQPKPAIAIPTQPKPAIKAPAKPNPSISAPAKPKPVNAIPKQPNNLAKQVAAAVPLAANRAFLVKKAEDKLTEGQKGWYKMMQRELEQSEQYQQMSNKARRKKMFKSKFAWLCNQNFITKEQTMMTLETLKQYHKDVEENKAQTKSAKKIARAKLVKRAAYAGVTPKEQKDIERNASKQKKLENKIELINARIRLIDGPLNRKEPTQKSFQKCFQFPAVLDLTRGYSTMETKEPSVVTGGYQYLNDGW
uniref:Uncharacterized protein n=1 Tax=Caenorhabditis japonica TaxID=281687 RepID=A0A8R1DMA8_CAEJA